MIKSILTTLILLTASAGLADDICTAPEGIEVKYTNSAEVSFDTPEGYTPSGDLYCWFGNTDLNTAFEEFESDDLDSMLHLVKQEVAEACYLLVEFDGEVETLNCMQDHVLPGGETVVLHTTKVLY